MKGRCEREAKGYIAASRADLASAPPSEISLIWDGAPFTFTPGEFTQQAVGRPNDYVIAGASGEPGAWLRQGANQIRYADRSVAEALDEVSMGVRLNRTSQNAALATALPNGTDVTLGGQHYRVNRDATGVASATSDLAVDGLVPANEARPQHFGAPCDGVSDDAGAFARFNALCDAKKPLSGNYIGGTIYTNSDVVRLDAELEITNQVVFDFGNSIVQCYAADYAFSAGRTEVSAENQIDTPTVQGGRHRMLIDGATWFYAKNAFAPHLLPREIQLRGSNQTAIHLVGNVNPPGPYYGDISPRRIVGDALKTGNTAIVYGIDPDDTPGGFAANRQITHGIAYIGAVDRALEIHGFGQIVSGVSFENIYVSTIRFNPHARSFDGTVASGGDTSTFADLSLIGSELYTTGSILVLTGANAGLSAPVQSISTSTGKVGFLENFPYPFAAGDTYTYFETKTMGCSVTNCQAESVENFCLFGGGASGCHVEGALLTLESASIIFEHVIEDPSNTYGKKQWDIVFEGSVTSGTASDVNLDAGAAVATRGGYPVSERCWPISITASGGVREIGDTGEIKLRLLSGGLDTGLSCILTPYSPNRAFRMKKVLTGSVGATGLLLPGRSLTVVVDTNNLAIRENLRVVIRLGAE